MLSIIPSPSPANGCRIYTAHTKKKTSRQLKSNSKGLCRSSVFNKGEFGSSFCYPLVRANRLESFQRDGRVLEWWPLEKEFIFNDAISKWANTALLWRQFYSILWHSRWTLAQFYDAQDIQMPSLVKLVTFFPIINPKSERKRGLIFVSLGFWESFQSELIEH